MLSVDVIGDLILILAVSALGGAVARRLGQPGVVGQILAGVALGPSLLGRLPGHLTERLFPAAALPTLSVLAQIAVVCFMFIVGYEMDLKRLTARSRPASLVAVGATATPLAIGCLVALALRPLLASLGQPPGDRSFVLFMGVALAVTALPVLVAVIRERGLAGTEAGVIATTAAGLMDVAAWVLLAAVLAATRPHTFLPWFASVLLIPLFCAVMLLGVRPLVLRWLHAGQRSTTQQVGLALLLAFGGGWVTAQLGLDSIFGGLLAGLTMSGAGQSAVSADQQQPAVAAAPAFLGPLDQLGRVLLPVFFAVTGLTLNLGDTGGTALAVLGVLCVTAAAGKLVPAYLGGRFGGLGRRDAATVAALVNTRGLTELIALSAGRSAGLLRGQLFTVMVEMALIMTIATAPLLKLIPRMTVLSASTAPAGALVPGAEGEPT